MLKMFEQLGTLPSKKVKMEFPEAGNHVIACELTSGCYHEVSEETIDFGKEVLGIQSKN